LGRVLYYSTRIKESRGAILNKVRVVIDTQSDVVEFVNIANSFPDNVSVYLEDGTGFRADAKSLMGVMYGRFEFKELWVLSEHELLSSKFSKFMI
jgi:hypothetical protein